MGHREMKTLSSDKSLSIFTEKKIRVKKALVKKALVKGKHGLKG